MATRRRKCLRHEMRHVIGIATFSAKNSLGKRIVISLTRKISNIQVTWENRSSGNVLQIIISIAHVVIYKKRTTLQRDKSSSHTQLILTDYCNYSAINILDPSVTITAAASSYHSRMNSVSALLYIGSIVSSLRTVITSCLRATTGTIVVRYRVHLPDWKGGYRPRCES